MIVNPYPGLRPFKRSESAIFFGREEQVDQLLDKLGETHFLAVLGASGSGKSSLVHAGLLPALDSGFMAGQGAHWMVAGIRPGDRPFERLAEALLSETPWGHASGGYHASSGAPAAENDEPVTELAGILRQGRLALNWRLGITPLPAGGRLLILVDQFEELFRYHRKADAEAAAFVSLLLGAATHPDVFVVITMRSEFLGDCSLYPDLPEAINSGLFLTPSLGPEQTADAIQLPARIFSGEVAPDLVRYLLKEAKGERDRLPLLQHALTRLWDMDREDRHLTLDRLGVLGGLRQALEQHAEEAYSTLNSEQQRIAEVMFRSLTERGPEERDTRRPVHLGEVADLAGVRIGEASAVVEIFRGQGRCFVLPPEGTPLERTTVIDISHEALIRQWTRLRNWTIDEAERVEMYLRLVAAALRWRQGQGALWIDPDLEFALQWRERTQPSPRWAARYGGDFAASMAFLDASHAQRTQTHRELAARRALALRRAKITALAASLGLVIVAGVAGWGWWERQRAWESEQQRTSDLFDSGLTHGALLSRTEDYAAARRVLESTRQLDPEIPRVRRLARNLSSRYANILGGSSEQVYLVPGVSLSQAIVSPDGRWLAACGERGTLVLFDVDSGELVHRLRGHDPRFQLRDCVFHPDGQWLASAGDEGRILIWSMPAPGEAPAIQRRWLAPGEVMALAVSPDGQLLASGGTDHDITLWRAADGTQVRTLKGHTDRISEVTGLSFAPRGGLLASASYDGTARLWDPATGAQIAGYQDHSAAVKSVAFSRDGRLLATGGDDNRVILRDLEGNQAPRVFTGHRNMVYGLAFAEHPDEPGAAPLLVAAGFDRTLRVWDSSSAATLRLFQGHSAAVNGIDIHGGSIFSAANDGSVRRWGLSLPYQRLLEVPEGEPASAAISPDGRFLALGLADGGLQLYALPNLALLHREPTAHAEELQRLDFSPDGRLLASGGFDGKARLWQVLPDGRLVPSRTLVGHVDAIHAVAFSPDGQTVATAGYDGQIGLFDTASGAGKFISTTRGQVLSVAFGPNGQLVYSADRDDGSVREWDIEVEPPVLRRELPVLSHLLLWAEPDVLGTTLAAVGTDYTVSIVNLEDNRVVQVLPRHENSVFKARFLPGGGQLATVSVDATVRLWDLHTNSELFTLRLPTNQGDPIPLWDFDLRCTPTGCWLVVPLTRGKLALYNFGMPDEG